MSDEDFDQPDQLDTTAYEKAGMALCVVTAVVGVFTLASLILRWSPGPWWARAAFVVFFGLYLWKGANAIARIAWASFQITYDNLSQDDADYIDTLEPEEV